MKDARPTRGIVKNGYVFLKSSEDASRGKSKMRKKSRPRKLYKKIPAPHFRAAGSKLIRLWPDSSPVTGTHAN